MGCRTKFENIINQNISEKVEYVFSGKKDDKLVNLICGYREVNYKSDGNSNELIQYGVIEVYIADNSLENINYKLFVGREKYSGKLLKNPFGESYVSDIKNIIDKNQHIIIELDFGGSCQDIKLSYMEMIDSDKVLDIFVGQYKKELKNNIKNGKLCGEIFIKIIYDNEYYYYINFVSISSGQLGIIVSSKTSEILAKNNTLK